MSDPNDVPIPEGMKYCPKCCQNKVLAEFGTATRSRDGKFTYCRPCTKSRNDSRTPETRRKWYLRKKYNISSEQYDQMWKDQNGMCAICGKFYGKWIPSGRNPSKYLAVDHDHITGKVRSLLCIRCNTTLGQVEDNIEVLIRATEYLQRHLTDHL